MDRRIVSTHSVVYVSETERSYRGVTFPWRGFAELEGQMAEIDRQFSEGAKVRAEAQRVGETEAQFQARVVAYAKAAGWMVYHTFDSRKSEPGFPDLVMVRGEDMVCAELKSEAGRLKPEQAQWIAALGAVEDVDAFVWRPSNWDELMEVLA